ncbi:sulfatase [Actinoplanes sp. TFC3]|uniref:sulfatase family protein n=1 Tax=Actinoplanes sp. TFC3 TaxID=1710355 RepID=UPI000A96273C|nr:sulfatase [Actinoplanes sp. TFC3]
MNVVFVLADDLSMNLLPHMPNVQALAKDGTTFTNYTVTDSLCCPSRSSIFTGRYPHNTGVFTNSGKDGGFHLFRQAQELDTVATTLKSNGYRTGFMGKYLNEYQPVDGVRPGWTDWAVGGNAYANFNYKLNDNGTITPYGSKPEDYLTSVVQNKAVDLITDAAKRSQPFLLEIATFSPHGPYTPAPQDKDLFPGMTAPRTTAFNKHPENAPPYLAGNDLLTPQEINNLNGIYRKRAQSVQSIDRMIGSLRDTLSTAGIADRTVVVFSSDNGFHLGDHGLNVGKQTAFSTDVHVPLVAAGPGIRKNATVDQLAENIDLRPTFEDLAGLSGSDKTDGSSLVPLLRTGKPAGGWRQLSLVEHHGPKTIKPGAAADDPDKQSTKDGTPPTYTAIRTADWTFVRYLDGTTEYYDRTTDPDEMRNIAASLPAERVRNLQASVQKMVACKGSTACTAATQ